MDGAIPGGGAAEQIALREKVFAAEKNSAGIRLAVVVLNAAVYPTLLDHTGHIVWLAYALLAVALAYSAFVVLAKPYHRYPALLHSYFTSITDAVLITVWLWATGGFNSVFFVLWYASIVGVAFRYSYRQTMYIAAVYALAYTGLLLALDQTSGHVGEIMVRVGYIFFVGAVGGEVSSEAFRQARSRIEIHDEKLELERRVADRSAQLEAANKELESFSYSVSHDLRAPLRSMDGFSRILVEDYGDQLDPKARDYLQRISAASERMTTLIDDILELSRLSRQEMQRRLVNLSDVAATILADLRKHDPEREVRQLIHENALAEGDPGLLRILLENLLSNAWKFTSKHPTASIEFGVILEDQHPTYFVRDDGAGFDMTFADKLFGAFQRLHGATEFEGTGIGLATVQRIARRHGGKVWAEAEVEGGATFYFTLGESPAPPAAIASPPEREEALAVG